MHHKSNYCETGLVTRNNLGILNIVMKKLYAYDSLHTDFDIQCTANAIVDLCQDRDNQRYDFKNTLYQLIASTAC